MAVADLTFPLAPWPWRRIVDKWTCSNCDEFLWNMPTQIRRYTVWKTDSQAHALRRDIIPRVTYGQTDRRTYGWTDKRPLLWILRLWTGGTITVYIVARTDHSVRHFDLGRRHLLYRVSGVTEGLYQILLGLYQHVTYTLASDNVYH